MGDKQKKTGSVMPSKQPAYLQPRNEDVPSLRGGFKPDAEALFEGKELGFSDPKH